MRLLIVLGTLPYLLLVPVWGTLFPIYAKDIFRAGPQGLGMLLTAVGIGGTLGGIAANVLAYAERQALKMTAPEEMRGRVSSLIMLYPAMISVGAFVAGPLSDRVGVRGSSVAVASTAIAAVALLYFFSPQLREIRFR